MALRILLSTSLLLFTLLGLAQDAVFTEIKDVVVYRRGVTINRTASVPVQSGSQEIILSGFSTTMDPNSIQVSTDGQAEILSISRLNKEQLPQPKMDEAQSDLIAEIDLKIWSLNKEEELLGKHQMIKGSDDTLTPEQMRSYATYYRERLLAMAKEKRALKKEKESLKSTVQKKSPEQIYYSIQLLCKSVGQQNIQVSYFDRNASWQTAYDLKLSALDQPLNLTYKGLVVNSTHEDWKDIDITLSTGNPRRAITPPTLQPWYLDPHRRPLPAKKDADQFESNVRAQARTKSNNVDDDDGTTSVSENVTALEFKVGNRVSIARNQNNPFALELKKYDVAADLRYVAIPKISQYAYLKAFIPDWTSYQLSQGQVSVFIEGSFQGKTYLNPAMVDSDTLEIAMGVDIAIRVDRERMKKFTERQWIGKKQEFKTAWEITVVNQKSYPIEITVYDQIPISSDESIEVDIQNNSNAKQDTKGQL